LAFIIRIYHDARSSECQIKMDLQEITREAVKWIDLASDREKLRAVVNAVYELRIQ